MKNQGFTLIELMIFIAIIGIFATIVAGVLSHNQKGAQQPSSEPAQESPSKPAKQDFNPNEVQW